MFDKTFIFDRTLIKDLTEMIAKSLTFPDIEWAGQFFFKKYSSHKIDDVSEHITISPIRAARILIDECERKNKLKDLFAFCIEMDDSVINGKLVKMVGLENLLFRLSRTGIYFNFNKRKFVALQEDASKMQNWGALRDSKEYPIIIGSLDICENSKLVKKHTPPVMESVYYQLWEFLNNKLYKFRGRIWSWAGDGGIIAFREEEGIANAVCCCLEIMTSMSVFNVLPQKPIPDSISLRIGMDFGNVKFYSDTGRIVSDVINYAAHLEKLGTPVNGISVSDVIYDQLTPQLKKVFKGKKKFEQRTAYSLVYNFSNAVKGG